MGCKQGFDRETAAVLALELFRQDKVSLGRAAELCQMPLEDFMGFATRLQVPLHYDLSDLEEDRRNLEGLALEGYESGDPIEVGPEFWKELHDKIDRGH